MTAGSSPWTGFVDPREAAERAGALARHMSLIRGGAALKIGATPKAEIWRDGKVTLHRYRQPDGGAPRGLPLLIIHGLVGRHTITDLEPGRSLVENLLAADVDLFVIDWGNPGPEDRLKDFTDYAEDHLGDALAEIARISGGARAALLGVCQGGVFALCHAARHPDRLAGVVTTITPVDFHADRELAPLGDGLLNHWIRNLPEDLIRDMIAERGALSGQWVGSLFQQLAPARTLAKYTYGLAALAHDTKALDRFLRMEKWLADRPDMPGAAALEWLIGLYHENRLVEGRFEIAGAPVDLGAITCPVLNIYGSQDHIIPPACSRALGRILRRGRYGEVEVPAGHVGVFVSAKAQTVTAPAILDWIGGLK